MLCLDGWAIRRISSALGMAVRLICLLGSDDSGYLTSLSFVLGSNILDLQFSDHQVAILDVFSWHSRSTAAALLQLEVGPTRRYVTLLMNTQSREEGRLSPS